MDKRQNLRRRETTAEKPQEGGAVQPGSGSEGAQAQKTVGGGGGNVMRWLGARTAQAQAPSGEAGP